MPVTEEEVKTQDIEVKEYVAIWNTGATSSVITKKVAADLDLKPIAIAEMRHAGGKSSTNVYLINIALPNNVIVQGVRVSEADLTDIDTLPPDQQSQVLIGMDIIGMGDFAVTSVENKTVMSFCIPNAVAIDFIPVAQEQNIMNHGNREQKRQLQKQKGK